MLEGAVRENGLPVERANRALVEVIVLKKERGWFGARLLDTAEAVEGEDEEEDEEDSEEENEGGVGEDEPPEDVYWRPLHVACKNCDKPWSSQLLDFLNPRQGKMYQKDPDGNSIFHYPEVLHNPDFLAKLLKKVGKANDPGGWFDKEGLDPVCLCLKIIGEHHKEEVRLRDQWVIERETLKEEGAEKAEVESKRAEAWVEIDSLRLKRAAVQKSWQLLQELDFAVEGRVAKENLECRLRIRNRLKRKAKRRQLALLGIPLKAE
uniref:Uncharacterized protein n=1 Tax=Chromera velia CCMP2878 TaxID=1169474 RepID=A0A0G4IER2_9ALVE|eukprot:Cvel_13784.t1-p1 / transcript=Cvel_13784.t1 / gene=Cvel_13784 / organism=Chromera_velia_CCMP2878 / gene_product=hypothetical protein / transcript_product=hypothetical protein / location=Cvel_scaffold955:24858-25646(+) / protein_length=263 / sequence_SO=supercontig / SO=protein_coding / is_pseudo=false